MYFDLMVIPSKINYPNQHQYQRFHSPEMGSLDVMQLSLEIVNINPTVLLRFDSEEFNLELNLDKKESIILLVSKYNSFLRLDAFASKIKIYYIFQ